MKMKQIISLLLSFVMVLGMLSGCGNNQPETTDPSQNTAPSQTEESSVQNTTEPDTTEPVVEEQPETIKAREMGLIPAEWDGDLSVEADFAGHRMISAIHPWSYTDMAALFDIYNEDEINKFCKGDIFAWGKDVAKTSFPMREYQEGAEIDEIEYRKKYQQVGEELLTKAGYRLAKILNDILSF